MFIPIFLFLLLSFRSVKCTTGCGIIGISDSDRNAILNAHNTLRSKIAKGNYVAKNDRKPPATNMRKMFWDCELEAMAQEFANQCTTGHSSCSGAGENIWRIWSHQPVGFL